MSVTSNPIDGEGDEYSIPKPSKIRLPRRKETKSDKAARLFAKESRRAAREVRRIARANGKAVTPPRAFRPDSTSPPRHASTKFAKNEDEGWEETGVKWAKSARRHDEHEHVWSTGRSLRERLEKEEMEDKIRWLAQEEMSRFDPDDSGLWGQPVIGNGDSIHIPKRWREAAGSSTSAGGGIRRDPVKELSGLGGRSKPPDMGSMTEEEYSEFIREGMYRLKHAEEIKENERRRVEREKKEVEDEKRRVERDREERKRIERLEKEGAERERGERERRKKKFRLRYGERWKLLIGGGVDGELRFEDIPWPVYPASTNLNSGKNGSEDQTDLSAEGIAMFLEDLAKDGGTPSKLVKEDTTKELRKVLRESILNFHPDRFFSRYLSRIKDENERARVKEGVEICSRVINDLAAGLR